jgi:hypothetical protein
MKTKITKTLAAAGIMALLVLFTWNCRKTDKDAGAPNGEFNTETVKAWFNSEFVNTAEYKNGTRNGADLKMPDWKHGKVYNIGQYKVAEFPLFINKRRVYVPETLAETDAKRVVAGTLYKALFVQQPNGHIETRILQFTPTYNYLANKHFDISATSFKDYATSFKGDVMVFDYNNNLQKGWHLSNGKPKSIELYTKLRPQGNARQSSSNLCDNAIQIEPNCYYTIHTVFDYQCSGGWNVNEGFNPDYCQITQIVSVECELQYCEDPGVDLIQECMNNGYTQAECMCQVYGVGCESIGGDDEVEVVKTMEWHGFYNNVYGTWTTIWISDRLKGKRRAGEPQGGHFTDIKYLGPACYTEGVIWDITFHESSHAAQTAQSHVICYATKGNNEKIYSNRTKQYNFNEVF